MSENPVGIIEPEARPSANVRLMHNTPMGPIGAAIEKPINNLRIRVSKRSIPPFLSFPSAFAYEKGPGAYRKHACQETHYESSVQRFGGWSSRENGYRCRNSNGGWSMIAMAPNVTPIAGSGSRLLSVAKRNGRVVEEDRDRGYEECESRASSRSSRIRTTSSAAEMYPVGVRSPIASQSTKVSAVYPISSHRAR
jgi:hypothetical protein